MRNRMKTFEFTGLVAAMLVTGALTGCGSSSSSVVSTATTPVTVSNQLYTETNEQANAIVHMSRNSDGSLTVQNKTYTGGTGTNGVKYGGSASAPDSLASNRSVIITPDKSTLFAVNAADNSVSSFAIDPATGNLTLKSVSTTAGIFPNSLAYNNGVLYVSFLGGSENLQAYSVKSDGSLAVIGAYELPVNGSNANAPTEVVVAPGGGYVLAITGPGSNQIVSYPINSDGTLGGAIANTTGVTAPFGGFFTNTGEFLADDITDKGLAAYSFSAGVLTAAGAPVSSGINAPCWLAITPNGEFAYVGNGQGPISSYIIGSNGSLTLKNATEVDNAALAVSGDSWVSPDSKYLYTAYLANDEVIAYSIGSDGSLTPVGSPALMHTITGISMQGLAGI